MEAGWQTRLSTPPRLSARVKSRNRSKMARPDSSEPSPAMNEMIPPKQTN